MIFLGALAVCGCDLLDSSKADNPVFGPPPPRKSLLSSLSGDDKPGHAKYIADPQAPAAPPSILAQSPENGSETKTASTSAKGNIRQTAFTGRKSPEDQKISDHEVVATVNGQPIFALEIFERSFPEQLRPDGMNLLYASHNLATGSVVRAGQVTIPEYRQLQEMAIRKYLKEFIRTRLLVQAFESSVPKEQREKMEEALKKMCDEYIDKLQAEFKVDSHSEVNERLRIQGTTVESLKAEFRYRVLSDEFLRVKSKKAHVVGRAEILAYYEEHIDDYSFPEKVRWQLLQISFNKHGGQQGALNVLEKAVEQMQQGADFGAVAKKYSDGLHADDGGKQPLTKPDSIREEKIATVLRELPVGETSPVLTVSDSYRLIRVLERKPAGQQPLSEVQDDIRQTIEDTYRREDLREVLLDLYKHASIESPYMTREEIDPTAEFADPAPALKKSRGSTKKGSKRS